MTNVAYDEPDITTTRSRWSIPVNPTVETAETRRLFPLSRIFGQRYAGINSGLTQKKRRTCRFRIYQNPSIHDRFSFYTKRHVSVRILAVDPYVLCAQLYILLIFVSILACTTHRLIRALAAITRSARHVRLAHAHQSLCARKPRRALPAPANILFGLVN